MAFIEYVHERGRGRERELEDLSNANGFTADDLAVNRIGKIGAGQIPKLVEMILRPLLRSFLVTAGWLMLIVVATWGISAGLHRGTPVRPAAFLELFWLYRGLYILTFVRIGAVIMVISCAGTFIVALVTATVKSIGLILDLLDGRAAIIDGPVYASEQEKRGSPWDLVREQWTRVRQEREKTFWYTVRDVKLEVSYDGFRALASGGRYRVYCTPRSKLLLSVEPAGDNSLIPSRKSL